MQKNIVFKNSRFRSHLHFNKISPFRFYAGIFVGIGYAFVLYFFSSVLREALRIFSITEDCNILTYTNSEMNFYNFFFASLSVIFAQSITFNFWLNKSRSFFERYDYKRKMIINEQRTLNWYFIGWFSEITFSFVIFFFLTIPNGYYAIDFYMEYKYLFIFILIVLYLQTWNTLRLTFIRRSLAKMLITAAVLFVFSFGLSKVHVVDSNSFNQSFKKSCCDKCIPKKLPKVKYFKKSGISFRNIYLNNEALNLPDPIIKVNSEIISIFDFNQIVKNENPRNAFNGYLVSPKVYKLIIDNEVKMKYVNLIKTILAKNNIRNISYAVLPKKTEFDKKYYYDYRINSRINSAYLNDSLLKHFFITSAVRKSPILVLKSDILKNIYLNDSLISKDGLTRAVKTKTYHNPKLLIVINIEDDMTFGTYFKMWNAYYEAVYELRNEYSFVKFTKKYDELYGKEFEEVRKKYPFRIFEMTDRMKKFFK